jgi:hypothetical protein
MIRDRSRSGRGVAVAVAVAAFAALLTAPLAGGAVALQENQDDDAGSYSVVQGGECTTVTSIGDGSQTVEEFYDYRTPETDPSSFRYGSFGTTHLQRDDTSTLFFYRGSEGVSLVVLHDRLRGDTEGGAVTMEFRGLPLEGEWVVEDDDYGEEVDSDQDDEFIHRDRSSQITWVYAEARNDGAAFRGGLDEEFEISVDPSFNNDAEFRVYDGEITDWEVISSERNSDGEYERTDLEFESVRILPGPCTSFAVTDLSVSDTVQRGENATVEATVVNDGTQSGTVTVPFRVDGHTVAEREVTVDGGGQQTVSTTVELNDTRTYDIAVENRTAQLEVVENQSDDGETTGGDGGAGDALSGGFGLIAGVAAALVAAAVARRR